jgi:putative transposase
MLGEEGAVMTTLDGVTKKKPAEQSAEAQAAAELLRLAQEQGLSLTGPDGLLKQLTKTVLETALNEEMTDHLGYEKHDPPGAGTGNIRNGTRAKTVLTDTTGPVELDVPVTGPRRSNPRSSRNASGGCRAWMRWCCRCMPKA